MAIRVRCPTCGHAFKVQDKYRGRRGRCPKCGDVVRIVDGGGEAAAEPLMPPEPGDSSKVIAGEKTKASCSDETNRAQLAELRRAKALEMGSITGDETAAVEETPKSAARKGGLRVAKLLDDKQLDDGPRETGQADVVSPAPLQGDVPAAQGSAAEASTAQFFPPQSAAPQFTAPQSAVQQTAVPEAALQDAPEAFPQDAPADAPFIDVGDAPPRGRRPRAAKDSGGRGPNLVLLLAGGGIAIALLLGLGAYAVYAVLSGPSDKDAGGNATGPRVASPASDNPKTTPVTASRPPTTRPAAAPLPPEAANLNAQAPQFTVKLRVTKFNDYTTGSGFFVDGKGWIATSYDLIDNAAEVDVQFGGPSGTISAASSGIVAASREHDLALIAVRPPRSISAIPLSSSKDVASGAAGFVCTMPPWGDRWVSPCRLVRETTTSALPPALQSSARAHRLGADDARWIELDGSLTPDAVGGPLLDSDGVAKGVCLMADAVHGRAYAVPARYLAELLNSARSSDVALRPFPGMPQEMSEIRFAGADDDPLRQPAAGAADSLADNLLGLRDRCNAVEWLPTTAEQYADFQELSVEMVKAAVAADAAELSAEQRKAVSDAVQQVLAAELEWTEYDRRQQVNRLASSAIDADRSSGIYAFGQVVLRPGQITVNGQPAVVFDLEGSDEIAIVPLSSGMEELLPGTRWLIFGVHRGRIKELSREGRRASIIEAKYILGEPVEQAEPLPNLILPYD